MGNDNTALYTKHPLSFETLPNDPLVRIMAQTDGGTEQDLSAALRIAYTAVFTAVDRRAC